MSMEMMARINIDGKFYDVRPGKNLLETSLALGINIPHFCFHAALGSVGACRLCAVKKFRDENDNRGRIVMSCMEPVTDGLLISVDDQEAKDFRASVIEGLMTNHPHDCPVCDEGGECHLQDMTVMTGHTYRKFDFRKRTYRNQDLGPFISHEMNRCIQCYRCVRFYKDYAGGKDLDVFGAHNHVYFGRIKDGPLESEFSGNLAEVCPTGVFTDKTFKKHFVRKWDLNNSPSVCVHCSLGCNTIVGERYDMLRRVMNRYNGAVNGYFLCDRGRFGYEFVNSDKRVKKPMIRSAHSSVPEEVEYEKLKKALADAVKSGSIAGIGSPRASLESNYALLRLVGEDNFYHGIPMDEYSMTREIINFMLNSGVEIPSLKQTESADAVIIVGEDLVNRAPMAALSVRQATRNRSLGEADGLKIARWDDGPVRELAQDRRSPLFVLTPFRDSLDDIAEKTFRGSLNDIASLTSDIISIIQDPSGNRGPSGKDTGDLAIHIAEALKNAKRPLVIAGTGCRDSELLHAAMNLAVALDSNDRKAMFSPILSESNSMGLALLPGKALGSLIDSARKKDTVIMMENDVYRRAGNDDIDRLLVNNGKIIVLDHILTRTGKKADIILPSATFAEGQGTIVNNEGRAQRYYRAVLTEGMIKDSWKWINELLSLRDEGNTKPLEHFDDLIVELVNDYPVFGPLRKYMPDSDFRMLNAKIPRQTLRYSGRTAIHANVEISEKGVPQDPDSPLAFTMEGQPENPPSSLVPFYWSPGWNSVQALYSYQDEPGGSMKGGDPGVRILNKLEKNDFQLFKISNHKIDDDGGLMIVPLYRIFGSEELSSVAPAIEHKIRGQSVIINGKDAAALGISDSEAVNVVLNDAVFEVTAKVEDDAPQGTAGLTVGYTGMSYAALPSKGKVQRK